MTVKVIIVDEYRLFRVGLNSILKDFDGVKVIGEAENGEELWRLLKHLKPDIIFLSLNMPIMGGYDVLEKLNEKYKNIKIIMLSMYDGDKYITKAIEAGACGYLEKNASADEIKLALESIQEMGYYFNEKTNKAMLHRIVQKKKSKPVFDNNNVSLNDSENGVVKYICDEMTSDEIAKKMFLSKRSIEGIRSQLIDKVGCKNAVGLALWAAKTGIVDL